MKVLIEASEAYRNHTGIGRFSRELIAHLPPELSVAYSPRDYHLRQHMQGRRTLPMRITNFLQHIKLTQWDVVHAARCEKPSLIHSLNFFVPLLNRSIPTIATIFDLAYFDLPDKTDAFWGTYGRKMMPIFAHHAAAILTTSHVTKSEIVKRFGTAPDKIYCVYGGVSDRFHPVTDEQDKQRIRQTYGLNEAFVLYVGAWHATKNLPVLIEAFAGITSAALVLTGTPYTEEQKALPVLAKRLNVNAKFIGYVPDSDLPVLYSLARAVVLPSLYEGFGLPIVEAMACGTPVIVSDIPILKEVADNAALSFPRQDSDALREQLTLLIEDQSQYEVWRERALQRAHFFSWDRTALQVRDMWQEVATQKI